jgi:hypothetical protein
MNTPMEAKLKLLVDTSSKLIDATLYRQIIGSLMYLTNTRPNICFVMNTLSQFLVEPRHVHLVVAKHVMRYLHVNVYAIIIVLCISIDKSNIRTRSLRNTHSQETQHLSWETL